jgi:PAS domain S-box-containing protein
MQRATGKPPPPEPPNGLRQPDGQRATRNMARDITDRGGAEEEIRLAHAEMEQILQAINSILIGVGPDDKITWWNAAAEEAFGILAKSVLGKPFLECGVEWDWPGMLHHLSASLTKDTPTALSDIPHRRPDGQPGMLSLTVHPIPGPDGGHSGYLLLGSDVTERKILESQLAQSQKLEAIGQLAAGIAHEINTPTQYVGDNTRFLGDAFKDLHQLLEKHRELLGALRQGKADQSLIESVQAADEEADLDYLLEEIPKAVAQSLEGVERVTKIVRAMKEFSHPGGEEKTAIDINRAIESTVTVARNEWKYVADMELELDPSLPQVPCVPGDFNQVILNLIVNASHAIADVVGDGSKGKGTITITTRHAGDWAEIRIADSGTGIREEIRPKIFNHFFTTKEVGKGTGQGLALARTVIVKKHGGIITFESEVGRGTTFFIRLPLNPPGSQRA